MNPLEPIPDQPLRPAIAYYAVAAILGDRWFLRQPPTKGVRVIVVGTDNVATQWDMEHAAANHLIPRLYPHPDVVRASAHPFANPAPSRD